MIPSGAQPPGRLMKLFAVIVGAGSRKSDPVAPELKRVIEGEMTAFSPRFAPVMVLKGWSTSSIRAPWVRLTMNGRSASSTYRFMPRATRDIVASARGRTARSACFAMI